MGYLQNFYLSIKAYVVGSSWTWLQVYGYPTADSFEQFNINQQNW